MPRQDPLPEFDCTRRERDEVDAAGAGIPSEPACAGLHNKAPCGGADDAKAEVRRFDFDHELAGGEGELFDEVMRRPARLAGKLNVKDWCHPHRTQLTRMAVLDQ